MKSLRCPIITILAFSLMSGSSALFSASFKKDAEIRTLSADYADCVIKKANRLDIARDFVGNDLPSEVLSKRGYNRLIDGNCLLKESGSVSGIQMRFPGELYRYALAGALVRVDFGTSAVADFSSVSALLHRPMPTLDESKLPKNKKKAAEAQAQFQSALMNAFMARYAECVVRKKASASHALLMANIASAEEKTAFGNLSEALAGCMPGGSTVRFGKENLRGAMAVAYFRLAAATSQQAPKNGGAS
jgi:hypothetical protein